MKKRHVMLAVLIIGMSLPLLATEPGITAAKGNAVDRACPLPEADATLHLTLNRSSVLYTPERVAGIRAMLAAKLRPDAMDALNAVLPETCEPVVMTPQLRFALLKLYVNSARQPMSDQPGGETVLTFLRETSKGLMSERFEVAASRQARKPRKLDTAAPYPDPPPDRDCSCYTVTWQWVACEISVLNACDPIRDVPPPVLVEFRLLDRTPSGLSAIAPQGDASNGSVPDARSASSGSDPIAATSRK